MTDKPVSEVVFEAVCESRGVQYRKLATQKDQRTADYLTLPGREKVVVEATSIKPNEKDEALAEKVQRSKSVAWWGEGRKRVNSKIKSKAGQLRSVANGRCPSILMIRDERSVDSVDNSDVLEAMYGVQAARFLIDHEEDEIIPAGLGFGGERQMTKEDRLYISAVGIMRDGPPSGYTVDLYHNTFATGVGELDCDTASHLADRQYALRQPKTKEYQPWERVR